MGAESLPISGSAVELSDPRQSVEREGGGLRPRASYALIMSLLFCLAESGDDFESSLVEFC